MSLPGSRGWSGVARSAFRGACTITCVIAAWPSLIWAFRLRIGGDQSEQEAPTSGELAGSPDVPSASPAISELSADNEVALELALWDSVKEGSPAELESYLEQYPQVPSPRSPELGSD